MEFLKRLEKIKKIDKLIQQGKTGSSADLARRLGVERITILRYIKLMKDMGAPIKYSRDIDSYIYLDDFKLDL